MTTYGTGDVPTGAQLGDAYELIATKSADTTNATTTIADDAELVLPVEANSIYVVQLFAPANAPAATDIKVEWSVPSGSAGWWSLKNRTLVGGADTVYQGKLPWASQGQAEGSPSDILLDAFGVLATGGTAGQIKFRWAAFAAGTAAVLQYSVLILTKKT